MISVASEAVLYVGISHWNDIYTCLYIYMISVASEAVLYV